MSDQESAAVVTWLRLMRVYHRIQQAAASQLRDHGLTLSQFDVLAQVGADEGLTQQDLADRLLVTKSNVSQLLDRMARSGLVEREPEGRVCRLRLTAQGRAIREKVLPLHEALITEQFAALDVDERTTLQRILRELDQALGRANAEPVMAARQ